MGNNFKTNPEIGILFDRNKAFFGYGSGVPYARVVELFGKTAADYALPMTISRVIPATEPDENPDYLTFYPDTAFKLAAARYNMDAERLRIARCREQEAGKADVVSTDE